MYAIEKTKDEGEKYNWFELIEEDNERSEENKFINKFIHKLYEKAEKIFHTCFTSSL